MNLGHYASYWAKHLDDQPAAVFKEKILSWSALTAQSDAIAAMLQDMGVKKGDRVACMLHNSLEWVISYAAIFKVGAILVPLNPRYSEHELQEIGAQVKCSIVIAQPALIGKLAPGKYAQQDSDDAVYLYPVNGVPMLWQRMSEVAEFADADITCVRGAIAGGTPVSQTLLKRYADKGVCIRQTFGVTENSGMIAMPNEKFALEKSWACGWPLPTVELRIVNNENRDCAANDPGEILIRGEQIFKGYWENAKATQEAWHDGWYRTGDIGSLDDMGHLQVLDRTFSGGVTINDGLFHDAQTDLPFGGVGKSGIGAYNPGIDGFRRFSHARGVYQQAGPMALLRAMQPPYDKLYDMAIRGQVEKLARKYAGVKRK